MLKITRLLNKLVSGKNNNNRPVFEKNDSNNKVNRFGINGDDMEYIKKLIKSKN